MSDETPIENEVIEEANTLPDNYEEVLENAPDTSVQVKKVPNPTGKGGFKDHPENRNSGGRLYKANESFAYWFNVFKDMSVEDFRLYKQSKSDSKTTMAESLAYTRVVNARADLKEFQEIANRTEGMPVKRTEITGKDGGPVQTTVVEFIGGDDDDTGTEQSSDPDTDTPDSTG